MTPRAICGYERRKIAKKLTRRRRPTKSEAWCRTARLWLVGAGIYVATLLHFVLNKPQTVDLGNRPVEDDFHPHLPFIGGTPEKSLTPRASFGWQCMKIINRHDESAIRRPSAGNSLQYQPVRGREQ